MREIVIISMYFYPYAIMVYTALLTSININPTTFVLQKPMTDELIITWDVEYNGILNSSDTLFVTQQLYYNNIIDTSNCGMCPNTTSSTSATCNLTASDLSAGMTLCNVTVIAQVIECGITTEATTSEEYLVHSIKFNGKTNNIIS